MLCLSDLHLDVRIICSESVFMRFLERIDHIMEIANTNGDLFKKIGE